MHNKLTSIDIKKMQEEIEYRTCVLRPKLLKEVVRTRAFGDLSENAEYHVAKQEKNANDRRIRFLQNMIRTAEVVEVKTEEGTVGLFDRVTVYVEEDDAEETYVIVTTMREDALKGYISNESPLGSSLLGRREGDRVTVVVNPSCSYDLLVRRIEKGADDETLSLR